MFAVGECYGCGRMFLFNPYRVPTVRDPQGVKQPICRQCVERVNLEQKRKGIAEFPIPEDAYGPTKEV